MSKIDDALRRQDPRNTGFQPDTSFVGRSISPSGMKSFSQCPTKHFFEKLATSGYDTFSKLSADAHGTAVHEAIEMAFHFLQESKAKTPNPSSGQINKMIKTATTRAEVAMKQHVPMNNSHGKNMRSYTDQVINDYGKRYLTNPDMFVGSEQWTRSKGLGSEKQVAGIMDNALFDIKNDYMEIIDYKYAMKKGSDIGNDMLSAITEAPKFEQLQPLAYAYANLENNPSLNAVHFLYDIYWDSDEGKSSPKRQVKKLIFHRNEMNEMKNILTNKVSAVLEGERELGYNLKNRQQSDVMHAISSTRKGACNPTACGACPFRYQCSFKNFVEESKYTSMAKDGETFVDNELRKLDHLDDREYQKQMDIQMNEAIEAKTNAAREARIADLVQNEGIADTLAFQIADEETKILKDSYHELKHYKRGQFNQATTSGAMAARSKIPISILDRKSSANWMTEAVQHNIHAYADNHIEQLAANFNTKAEVAKSVVMDRVFKDREFASGLNKLMINNTLTQLEHEGISLGRSNLTGLEESQSVKWALKQYDKTINNEVAKSVQGRLNEEFVGYLNTIESDKIQQIMGDTDIKGMNVKKLVSGLTDKHMMEAEPEKFIKQVAKSESFGGFMARSKIGKSRFPVGSLALAGLLSYIAGSESIVNILKSKVDKMSFYASHNDEAVDDGTHASPYGISRRLLYSDFGSSIRNVLRTSKYALNMMHNVRTFFKDATSIVVGEAGRRRFGMNKNFFAGFYERMEKDILNNINSEHLFYAGTIGGIVAAQVLPSIKTDREISSNVKRKKRLFKQMKETKWNYSSDFDEPESELREGYRAFTPIGSRVFASIAANFISPSLSKFRMTFTNVFSKIDNSEGYNVIQDKLLKAWHGVSQRLENVYAKSNINQVTQGLSKDIAEKTSIQSTSSPEGIIKSGTNYVQSEFVKLKQKIDTRYATLLKSKTVTTVKKAIGTEAEHNKLRTATSKAVDKAGGLLDEVPNMSVVGLGGSSVGGLDNVPKLNNKPTLTTTTASRNNKRNDQTYYSRYSEGSQMDIPYLDTNRRRKMYNKSNPTYSTSNSGRIDHRIQQDLFKNINSNHSDNLVISNRAVHHQQRYPSAIPEREVNQIHVPNITNVSNHPEHNNRKSVDLNRMLFNIRQIPNKYGTGGSNSLQAFHKATYRY